MRSTRGFSLVELLIAMTLGMLLTGGMISAFIGNQRSSELNSAIANMQESARFALDSIARDVRSAGFQGCLEVQSDLTRVRSSNTPPFTDFLANAATGSIIVAEDNWQPAPPNGFVTANHDAVPGTHAISLHFGDSDTRQLSTQMTNGAAPSLSAPLSLTAPLVAEVGDFAIVSDCDQADIFTISGFSPDGLQVLHAAPNNSNSANLSKAYGAANRRSQTMVTALRSSVYYIGDTGQDNARGDDIHALYRQSLPFGDPANNPPIELVSGIENMRVSYGIRQPGGNLRYVAASSPQYNPRRVEAIQVGLLMASRDRIADQDDEKTYLLAGQAVPPGAGGLIGASHPADQRYRLTFNTTIKIRNRRYRQ